MLARNVFLIGPMGAGKTTVGRALSLRLGAVFHDSDQEIEHRTGVDIAYIFEKEGETGFRKREAQVIDELSAQPGVVLATGGGAILDAGTRARLKSRGTAVFLNAGIEQQLKRTGRADHRPLLKTGDRRETLERLFAIREPLYRETAHLVVDCEGRNARTLARLIAEQLPPSESA